MTADDGVADDGVADEGVIDEATLAAWPLPDPDDDADKHDRGQVLVVGGSVPVPGAPLLSGLAALRAGAGKLQIATVERNVTALGVAAPEALVAGLRETQGGAIHPDGADRVLELAERASAVLIGPGMIDPDCIAALVGRVVTKTPAGGPVVLLDAHAITSFDVASDALQHLDGRVLITPNVGELVALLDEHSDGDDRDVRALALTASKRLGAVVATRGWVTSPDGRAWRHTGGGVGLGTSGSGDVLAGIVTGLAARGAEPVHAAAWGLYAHAEAGERLARRIGRIGYLARELLGEIPAALATPAHVAPAGHPPARTGG